MRKVHKRRKKGAKPYFVLVLILLSCLILTSYLACESHFRAESLTNELISVKAQLTLVQRSMQELSRSLKNASQEILKQQEIISSLEENNANLRKELDVKNYELKVKEEELRKKTEQLSALQGDINKTLTELREYEERLNERMKWFKNNSNINLFSNYYGFEKVLRSKCLQTTHGTCTINLACLSFVNAHEKSLSYKTDEETSREGDALQNLESILANKGGDCEDFSILVMAELNYLKSFCKNVGSTTMRFIGFVPGSGVFYVENSQTHYIQNADGKELPNDYKHYYVVCGNFPKAPNIESSGIVGHCVIAFSNEPIHSSNDVYSSLRKAILVEPQSGEILYDLRTTNEMYVPLNFTDERKYFLYLVITDSDAYEFNEKLGSWKGFGDFLNFINEQKEKLNPNAFIS